MKHLRTACVVLAFFATTVSGSAQTSLTPGQSTTIYRTIIPQGCGRALIVRKRIVIKPVVPAPVMRERIVNPSAGSDVGPGAAQRLPQNNVFVNGALTVPGAPGTLGSTFWGRSEKRKVTDLDLNSGLTIFLLDPHFGGDGLVMVIRHRDPDKTWTIRHPSSWRPNWRRRQGLAVDGPTVRRRTAHGLESEWRER